MNTHAWSHAVPSQGARCPPRLEKSRQCCTCCSTQAESLRPPFCQTDNTGACTHALVRRCMLEHAAFACAHKFYARGAMAAECCPSCPAARMPWTPESVHAGLSETTVGCTRAADSGASQRPEEPQRVRLAAARRGCPCARVPAPRVAQLCVKRLLSPWVEQARLTCKVLPRGWLPQAERGHDARQVLQAVQDHRVCARHAACVSARAALAPEHHRKPPPPPPPLLACSLRARACRCSPHLCTNGGSWIICQASNPQARQPHGGRDAGHGQPSPRPAAMGRWGRATLRTRAARLQVRAREHAGRDADRLRAALHRRLQVHGRVACAPRHRLAFLVRRGCAGVCLAYVAWMLSSTCVFATAAV